METLRFPAFSPSSSLAHIFLFTSISPTTFSSIRQHIISASQLPPERERVNYAFINPQLITSKLHLQTAIYQAILSESQDSLRTKTVHSEILWALNPTNNISEAIRRYGVPTTQSTDALLIVRICGPDLSPSTIQDNLSELVQGGTLSPLDATLGALTDWKTIKRYHKLNDEPWMDERMVDNIVTSTVAMKSVAT